MAASRVVIVLFCSLLAAGCNQSPHDATVTGKVTLDGNPIGPGVIQFFPVGRGHNPASGAIGVNGNYELKTNNAVGIPPGEYQVTVAVYDQPELAPGERAAPGSAPLRTPEKYLSADTTDLTHTVNPGANTIDVTLVTAGE